MGQTRLEIRERADHAHGGLTLTLPFEQRQKSRLLVGLSNGEEAALLLARGSVLRGGDALKLSDGRTLTVVAAEESVSTVRSEDAQGLARVAYHLGNRHVPLEVGCGYVRYLHDHVLDGMVRELGLSVQAELAPFEPENGAYGRHGHSHTHDDHAHRHVDGSASHAHTTAQRHEHAHAHAHSHHGFATDERGPADGSREP